MSMVSFSAEALTMRWFFSTVLLAIALGLISSPAPSAEQAKDPLVDKVRDAIDKGKGFLLGRAKDGSWDDEEVQLRPGGRTSLALLALLNAGVPPSNSIIQSGLKRLRDIPPTQTYVVGLQTMVFAQAGEEIDIQRIQRNVDWLVKARSPFGWSYGALGGDGKATADNSNTQYALLGLHEGLQAGAKVDPKVLKAIQDFYVNTQNRGGWSYHSDKGQPTMTMTTAGVCGLLITGMDLAVGQQQLRDDGSAVNCGDYTDNEPVAAALEWIGERFPKRIDSDSIRSFVTPYYCLYGIERTGRISGQRYLGGHDWYRLGCEYLVSVQKEGSWEGGFDRSLDSQAVVATSFALLFLSKGRTPVLLTKFAHENANQWNNKRSDARHLVEFASKELFKDMFPKDPMAWRMAWQVFDVRQQEGDKTEDLRRLAAELLPSPIVYLNGHFLRLTDKEKIILKEYVNNGGFLFAEACCGDRREFDQDFRDTMKEMFPDSELKQVENAHPVWYASGKFAVDPTKFPLWGIQQGCKWVVMYSPKPLAGYWEANDRTSEQGKAAFQLGANIIAYATGLEPPQPRLTEVALVRDDVSPTKPKRGYLEVGQLAYDGDWKPAPRAMRFLMEEVRKTGLDVHLTTAQVRFSESAVLKTGESAPPIRKISDGLFFYLHGRTDFKPGKQHLKDLRYRLEGGATLLADACCGEKAFDAAFRRMMDEMWDKKLKLEPIPLTDELFSEELNGAKVQKVRCRREGIDGKRGTPEYQSVAPALEGIKYNGRWVVIYSRYDLGCALEKHPAGDCLGHDYPSAVQLARAAVLYALKR
jgi:Domain of unknown function (DUF4159)